MRFVSVPSFSLIAHRCHHLSKTSLSYVMLKEELQLEKSDSKAKTERVKVRTTISDERQNSSRDFKASWGCRKTSKSAPPV